MGDKTADESVDRKLQICPGHDGTKGQKFTRWTRMWLDAAEGRGDEDASWAETALGTDPGPGGLTPAQTRRRTVRRREVYASLIALTNCEDLKAVLRNEAQRKDTRRVPHRRLLAR